MGAGREDYDIEIEDILKARLDPSRLDRSMSQVTQ